MRTTRRLPIAISSRSFWSIQEATFRGRLSFSVSRVQLCERSSRRSDCLAGNSLQQRREPMHDHPNRRILIDASSTGYWQSSAPRSYMAEELFRDTLSPAVPSLLAENLFDYVNRRRAGRHVARRSSVEFLWDRLPGNSLPCRSSECHPVQLRRQRRGFAIVIRPVGCEFIRTTWLIACAPIKAVSNAASCRWLNCDCVSPGC